jgi:hypothetical protein
MAIQFLNVTDFNQNNLTNVVIEVSTSAPVATPGAIYFDSSAGDKRLTYYAESGWIKLDQYSINAAQDGDNVDLNLASVTGYTDSVVQFTAGTGITLTRNSGTEMTIAAVGSGTMTDWKLRDDDGDDKTVSDGLFVKFVSTTGTNGTNVTGTGTTGDPFVMTITSQDTTYSAATDSALGLVKLEDGTTQTTAAETVTTTANRTYGIQFNSSNQLVVNVPWTDTDTTYSMMTSAVLGLGKLFSDTEQSVASNAVTATASRTYGIQANSSDQLVVNVPWTDTTTNYTYALSVGAVSSNESTLSLVGSGGGATTTAKFSGTANEIEITTPGTGDGGDITIGLPDDVTIAGELTVSGTGQSSFGGQITIPATPSADTDAASKGYVDGLVSGGLTFKGTFRADTGIILSGDDTGSYIYNCPGGAGTRIAVSVGDYYVVATAGGSFYCSGDTLDIGDSIIGVTASAANNSVVGDWSVVQSDEGVVSFTNANGTYISSSTVNTNATGAVTMGTIDLSAVDGTSDTSTRFLSKDNTWDVPSYSSTYSAMTASVLGLGKLRYTRGSTPAAESQTETASRTYGVTDNSSNQLVVNVPWTDTDTTYSAATDSALGLVKLEDGTTQTTAANTVTTTASRTYGVQFNSSSQLVVNVPWTDTNTTYSAMTTSTFGLGKLWSDTEQSESAQSVTATASRTYGIQMNSSDQLVVNVPWTDTTGAVTSVAASSNNDELGAIVSPTTGAVKVGIDIKGATNLGAEPATDDEILIYDTDGDVNKSVTIANLASAVTNRKGALLSLDTGTTNVTQQGSPPSGTEGWVVDVDTEFGLTSGAQNVMCEVITSAGETVYADITRSTGNITINFVGSGIAQGTYKVILNCIV